MQIYSIDNRPFTYDDLLVDLNLQKDKNYLFALPELAILSLQGASALDFLQGQITCDMQRLSSEKMLTGAFCNLQGRVLSLVHVLEKQGIHLLVDKDLLEATQKSLAKAALLSRVSLKTDAPWSVFGFYCQNPADLMPLSPLPGLSLYAWDKDLYLVTIDKAVEQALIQPFDQVQQYRGSLAWHTCALSLGFINIYPSTRGALLPHRINLPALGYVDFQKGCYKGQEIIARMHYKSVHKHELCIFKFQAAEPPQLLQPILDPTTHNVLGEVVDYTPLNNGYYAIAASILKDRPEKGTIGCVLFPLQTLG